MTIDEAKAFFYVFLLLLFLILNLWHKASAASRNEIQEYIEEFQKKSGVKKVSVVVYEKGKIDYYGNTDTKSLYQIGSLTKSFTGLGILKLVKDGGISLTDDISELLDGFQAYFQGKRAQITVEDLLRHRSGFTNSERDYPSANPEMSLMEWVDSLSGKDLKFEPGIGYSYANTNYNLLGAIIERVSGKSYKEYMETEILLPLQLENVSVSLPPNEAAICQGTRLGYGMTFDYAAAPSEGGIPAGYFYANIEDMCRYLMIQLGEAQIPEGYKELIDFCHEYLLAKEEPGTYFAGWEYVGRGMIGHSGGTAGYSSRILFSKEKKVAVGVLANLNAAASTDRLCNDLFAITCNQEKAGFVFDVWRIFDLIFSGITILGIVLLIIAAFYFKKRKVLFFCVVTMLSLFIGQMLIIPLIFQSGWKKIALVWAPWSVLGGLMTQFIDIIVLSIMAIVRGKDADNSEKGGQPTTDRDCGISGLG